MAGPAETSGLFLFDEPQAGAPRRSLEIRNNFEAVVRTNFGTDPAKPASPREGMLRILKDVTVANNWKLQGFLSGAWQTLLQRINGGFAAPAKRIFVFNAATSPWQLQHDLGSQPLVQVFDLTYMQRQVVPAAPGAGQYTLQHADANKVIVTFAAPATGVAIVLG
jgi:hypothetical protein